MRHSQGLVQGHLTLQACAAVDCPCMSFCLSFCWMHLLHGWLTEAAHSPSLAAEVALASGELEEEQLPLAQKARALATALPAGYWQALATTFLLYLARFDVAFITVHASTVGEVAGPGLGQTSLATTQVQLACCAALTVGHAAWALDACSGLSSGPPAGLPGR